MTANTDIHTCSYYCERPECVKAQRDELRDRMESAHTSAPPSAPVGVEAFASRLRAGVDETVVERIAALLHEEATGDPWTVAGVEHPGPDRDYYRGLARKVVAVLQDGIHAAVSDRLHR